MQWSRSVPSPSRLFMSGREGQNTTGACGRQSGIGQMGKVVTERQGRRGSPGHGSAPERERNPGESFAHRLSQTRGRRRIQRPNMISPWAGMPMERGTLVARMAMSVQGQNPKQMMRKIDSGLFRKKGVAKARKSYPAL